MIQTHISYFSVILIIGSPSHITSEQLSIRTVVHGEVVCQPPVNWKLAHISAAATDKVAWVIKLGSGNRTKQCCGADITVRLSVVWAQYHTVQFGRW